MSVFSVNLKLSPHLEDCERGKSYVVKRGDPGVWSSPLFKANRYVCVADVGAPPEKDGGGCGVEGTYGASEGLPIKQGAPISPSFTISSEGRNEYDNHCGSGIMTIIMLMLMMITAVYYPQPIYVSAIWPSRMISGESKTTYDLQDSER